MGASGSEKAGRSQVPYTSTRPAAIVTASGSQGLCAGFASSLLHRCRAPSSSTVEMPAPTAASVMATSTASSATITVAMRKL